MTSRHQVDAAPPRATRIGSAGRHRSARPAAVLLLLVLLVAPLLAGAPRGADAQAPVTTPLASPTAPAARPGLVTLPNGHQLFLDCRGTGSPTVILEAGYRRPASDWSTDLMAPAASRELVFAGVAQFTRVCRYDRPGVAAVVAGTVVPGRSDPVPMPRPAAALVSDLHALLAAAGETGPYVLVGQSVGALLAQAYAVTYPDQVAGLVLIDPVLTPLRAELTPKAWAAYLALLALAPPALAADPAAETIDLDQAALLAMAPLPPLPLAVIIRESPPTGAAASLDRDPAAIAALWRDGAAALAAQSPRGRLIVAADSPFPLPVADPALVLNTIARVGLALREPGAYTPPPPATPPAGNPPVTPAR